MNFYMHPQAVIVDASDDETGMFLEAMRVQLGSMKVPLIQLPENSPEKLAWLTKLDSSSLACKSTPISQQTCANTNDSVAQAQRRDTHSSFPWNFRQLGPTAQVLGHSRFQCFRYPPSYYRATKPCRCRNRRFSRDVPMAASKSP